MKHPLRHSHIAIRRALSSLAKLVEANISSGEDDLGRYRFFDLTVSQQDGMDQRVRFASHDGDKMTHLLAERIDNTSDLAAALYRVGVDSRCALSISTDREGQPLRDEGEIQDRIAEISKASLAREPKKKKRSRAYRSIWKGPFMDGYTLKEADLSREASRKASRKAAIRVWSSSSTILPQFVGLTFRFYRGEKHVPVAVSKEMIGHKLGEFAPLLGTGVNPSARKKLAKKQG